MTIVAVLVACDKPSAPLVPATLEAVSGSGVSAVAGSSVVQRPTAKVTTATGTPVPGVTVVFAVTGGGGTLDSPTQTTNAEGIATVGAWAIGATAGPNTMSATVQGLPPVEFTVTGVAGPATKLFVATAPSSSAANRVVLATQPVIEVRDANNNVVTTSAATVTAAASPGSLLGTTTIQAVNGIAAFTDLAVSGAAGSKTVTFATSSLTSATAPVTTTPGVASKVYLITGTNQATQPGTAVPIKPAARVTDVDSNGVAGFAVTFAVTAGGGSITGANATTDSLGVATVGSWTLGATAGSNTLTATASGLTGSPVSFIAAGSDITIASVSPATLTSGVTATITGSGYSATPANNVVTIDSIAATVTAASATSLTITVPTLTCVPGHNGILGVSVNGSFTVTKSQPVQAATPHALTAGQSVVLSTAAAARCNELSNTGGLYYISVYNTNAVFSSTGAAFELKGTTSAASIVAGAPAARPQQLVAPSSGLRRVRPEDSSHIAHVQMLERNLEFLRENGRNWRRTPEGRSSAVAPYAGVPANVVVGDPVEVRLPNFVSAGFCNNFLTITGRVAYVGTKSIIVEDNANALAGTIDTTYAQIGSEFDSVMWPILENSFGNPIVNDATLDNNGRIVMVFTRKIYEDLSAAGAAGFVVSCDFFPRAQFASSNVGEYFYAVPPRVPGTIATTYSPPHWRWLMRHAIIHEVKHIVSLGERFFRNDGANFEESWLEETTATMSEELYERARYGFVQKGNTGYGSAGNQVGPYCGVRACNNQARGIVRVFEDLTAYTGCTTLCGWYSAPHEHSPLGRADASDFSFYATGWSLLRWAIDASANTEASILKGMTQEPTKIGIANFEQYVGITLPDALPKWTLAMAVDDYPGFSPADATLKQPGWNFRDVYQGYDADFTVPWIIWPLAPLSSFFGSFSNTASVRAGTAAVIQLSGAQQFKQLLELKASGSSAAAPAELRLAIVRVQ